MMAKNNFNRIRNPAKCFSNEEAFGGRPIYDAVECENVRVVPVEFKQYQG